MIFTNANIFTADKGFIHGAFRVDEGRFAEMLDYSPVGDGQDLGGAYVIPGLIDVHNHGNSGADFSDGDYEGVRRMARYLALNGVTAFAPASMTLPFEVLDAAFAVAAQLNREQPEGHSRLMGIQMEGPFFSEKKKGAQNAAYLRLPELAQFKKLYDNCGGLIKIADIAPELEGAEEFIREVSGLCTVSVAHTNCSYEYAKMAFETGARHLTHLFNAMPPIHHREPGVIGAASEAETVVAELICDGIHAHESAVRMAFKLFPGRICLVSDALRCCGMPDGEYMLGGQQVKLSGGVARLADGTIAGSATNLFDCMRKAISFGIAPEQAITAASLTPAKQIGCDEELGSIAVGKLADFVVCTGEFERICVYMGGELVQ